MRYDKNFFNVENKGENYHWVRKIPCAIGTHYPRKISPRLSPKLVVMQSREITGGGVLGSPGDRKYLPVARFPSKCSFWLPRRANSHRQRDALAAMRRAAVRRRLLAPLISSVKVDVWRR